jgi:hypothetical protein
VECCFSALLIKPLIEVCQMYVQCSLCLHCKRYHFQGLCPKYCLSLSRTEPTSAYFFSTLLPCSERSTRDDLAIFEDANDNETFNQFIASLLVDFPNRSYTTNFHDRTGCGCRSNVIINVSPARFNLLPRIGILFGESSYPIIHMSFCCTAQKTRL